MPLNSGLQEKVPNKQSGDVFLDILQNVFGHENFRGIQRDIAEVISANKYVLE